MLATEVIRRKRDGEELPDSAIESFLADYTEGRIPDYQMSALAMAVFFRGLKPGELASWTRAMLESGDILDFADITQRKVDKHSTGGVGDKVSIPLAPLVGACGVTVPMISGRGLGHTGGTLDKLESIPGLQVKLSGEQFSRCLHEVGVVLAGQSASLAPADKKLYALRDVTSTVESIPLIASSIMSKKLAEGIDGLVLDVKFGTGAFMRRVEDARTLAQTMIGIGQSFGKSVTAFLTDMNQPLGRAVGNALEIFESVDVLRGSGPEDMIEITLALGAEMLMLGGVADSEGEARQMLQQKIASGEGLRKLEQIVAAQGGNARALTDWSLMPRASRTIEVPAERGGVITRIETADVGRAAMLLGAGRQTVDDTIDPAVGLMLHKRLGDTVAAGESLATMHVNDESRAPAAMRQLLDAYIIGDGPVTPGPLILERLS